MKKLILTLLVFALFFGISISNAKSLVGVLSVNVSYPSKGLDWLCHFLQDELSLQLQLSEGYSVISPGVMSQWNKHLKKSSNPSSNLINLKKTEISLLKPDKIILVSVQKVLNKISVDWLINSFEENKSIFRLKKIHSWGTPDELISFLINDLKNSDVLFKDINHYPFNYSWEGIKSFYKWKKKSLPKVKTKRWEEHKMEMESLLFRYPEMSSYLNHHRAILKIFESVLTDPPNIPKLDSAEDDLVSSMQSHPGNSDKHNLLSLIHYLKGEKLFAKQQANIASKINRSNGISFILYGLTIGKTQKDGEDYILKGIRLYPFISKNFLDDWQPFKIIFQELDPWITKKSSKKTINYEELMKIGEKFYNKRDWEKATDSFKDAYALDPSLPEPLIHLAQIQLAQNNFVNGLKMLKKLRDKFPKNTNISLYLGFANEKLKYYFKAERLYREVLLDKPENHKALLRLGSVLIKLGKLDEAISFLENLTQKHPIYTVAWWNLGIAYYQRGDLELAEIALEESLMLEPENGQVRLILEQLREELLSIRYKNL